MPYFIKQRKVVSKVTSLLVAYQLRLTFFKLLVDNKPFLMKRVEFSTFFQTFSDHGTGLTVTYCDLFLH